MPVPFTAGRVHAGQPSHPADLLWAGLSGSGLVAGQLITTNFVPWRTLVLWHLFPPRGGTKTIIFLTEKDHDSETLKLCLPGQLGKEVPYLSSSSAHGNHGLDAPCSPYFSVAQTSSRAASAMLCPGQANHMRPCRGWGGTVECKIKWGNMVHVGEWGMRRVMVERRPGATYKALHLVLFCTPQTSMPNQPHEIRMAIMMMLWVSYNSLLRCWATCTWWGLPGRACEAIIPGRSALCDICSTWALCTLPWCITWLKTDNTYC